MRWPSNAVERVKPEQAGRQTLKRWFLPRRSASDGMIATISGAMKNVAKHDRIVSRAAFRVLLGVIVAATLVMIAWPLPGVTPDVVVMATGFVAALVIVFAWPTFILRWCRHEPLPAGPLRERLETAVADQQIGVAHIRVWNTRHRVANAAIVGLVPGRRVLLISDAMLAAFSTDELLAVIRHEAGHVRLHHGPIRMALVLVPLVLLCSDLQLGAGLHHGLEAWLSARGLSSSMAVGIFSIVYLAYLGYVFRTVFPRMEYAADAWAADGRGQHDIRLDPSHDTPANHLESALTKFGIVYPEQLHRPHGTHPPLGRRIERLQRASR